MKEITLIIPFLNEEDNIPALINVLNTFCKKSSFDYEVIFVDDGSSDDSVNCLSDYKNLTFEARIVKLSKNFGSHAALKAGISIAKGKFIGFLYSDMQDPVELPEKMRNVAEQKQANIVWATRKSLKSGFIEKMFSGAYAGLMKKYVSPDFPAKGFDIVLFDQKVKDQLNKNIESNSSIFLQILKMGFKQERIEYEKEKRNVGKSKWTYGKKIKLFIDSFVAFSYFPIRMVTVMGIVFFLLGILWTAYIVIRTLLFHDLEPGWPSLISILMIGFGVTNIGLGIVAEYLWRTLDAARKRPVYIIDEIINLSE